MAGNIVLYLIALGISCWLFKYVWATLNISLFFASTPKAREVITVINHGFDGALFGLLTYLITVYFTKGINWAWAFEVIGMLNCLFFAYRTQKPGVLILSGLGGFILSLYVFGSMAGFGISFLAAIVLAVPYNLTKLNFVLESKEKELGGR